MVPLKPFCDKIGSGATPRGGSSVYLDTGEVAFVRSQNIYNDRFDPSGLVYISDEAAKKLSNVELESGDILLNITGDSVARVALIPDEYLPARVNQHVAIIRVNRNEFDHRFVRYFLAAPKTQDTLLALASAGATRNALTKGMIEAFDVPKPSLSEQERIADILSSLDDNIELNRRLNETLEGMARAMFQSWFVDFDPVKAKLAAVRHGRDPERACMAALSGKLRIPPGKPKPDTLNDQLPAADAIDAAIAALDTLTETQQQTIAQTGANFAANFQDSELGLIPEGWEEGTLNNFCSLNGNSWTTKTHPEQVNYVDLANCKNGCILSVLKYEWKDAPSRARRVLNKGDTIVGTVRPGNRSFALIGESDVQLTGSTGFAVLSPKESSFREFIYLHACGDDNIARLAHLADGAAYPAVRPDVVTNYEIVLPPNMLLNAFSTTTTEFFDQINSNETQSRTLAELRDTLLPKLLSDELSVNEALDSEEAISKACGT